MTENKNYDWAQKLWLRTKIMTADKKLWLRTKIMTENKKIWLRAKIMTENENYNQGQKLWDILYIQKYTCFRYISEQILTKASFYFFG